MIIYLSFEGALLVKQIPLRPEELLVAIPGPATLLQTHFLGKERIASQSTLFPAHKAIREWPGLGKLVKARREETWIFSLQPKSFPVSWQAQLGLKVRPEAPQVKLSTSQGTKILQITAQKHVVQMVLPSECLLAPFRGAKDLEASLFGKSFGDGLVL